MKLAAVYRLLWQVVDSGRQEARITPWASGLF